VEAQNPAGDRLGSCIRGILKNPLYTGLQRWNVSMFVRNPETEKIVRRKRPKSEWVVNHDESLRIVSDELFAAAQCRTQDRSDPNKKLRAGGKPKYPLSGLLKCQRRLNFDPPWTGNAEVKLTHPGACY